MSRLANTKALYSVRRADNNAIKAIFKANTVPANDLRTLRYTEPHGALCTISNIVRFLLRQSEFAKLCRRRVVNCKYQYIINVILCSSALCCGGFDHCQESLYNKLFRYVTAMKIYSRVKNVIFSSFELKRSSQYAEIFYFLPRPTSTKRVLTYEQVRSAQQVLCFFSYHNPVKQ